MIQEENQLISHRTLADQAFDYLSKAILSGKLRTGDHLVESELSEKLGISRAPLRKALAELERQGLAYSVVRRGTFVRTWTKQDLWEVAILRATLEALVAELAVSHVTDDDVAFLEGVIAEMEVADRENDVDRLINLDFEFHDRVLELSQHNRVQQLINDMRLQVRLFRLVTQGTDYQTYPEMHRHVLNALKTGDAQVARESIYLHIMESAELALSALPDDRPISVSGEAVRSPAAAS